MKFVLNRSRVISSVFGHAIQFEKGVPTLVPPAMYPEVIAAGGVPESELTEDELPKAPATPEQLADREAALYKVFAEFKQRNRREDFTAGGAPKGDLLTAALGWTVQAKERDAAWVKFQLADKE
jgi:hypothetical protein